MNEKELDASHELDDLTEPEIMEALSALFGQDETSSASEDPQLSDAMGYFLGRGVEQSYPEAHSRFLELATKGSADAQLYLGLCYFNGWGCKQSFTKAAEWLRKAADQDVAEAEYRLGRMYLYGIGVKQSVDETAILLKNASNNLHKDAGELLTKLINEGIVSEEYEDAAIANLAFHALFEGTDE